MAPQEAAGLPSMARLGTRISKGLTCDWYELPIEAGCMKSDLNDAVGRAVADFAVWRECGVKGHQSFATGPNDEFANAAGCIQIAVGVLRGETFIVVGVAVDDQVGSGVVENLPERLHGGSCVGRRGSVERGMPESHGAGSGIRGQVGLKPLPLGRSGCASAR